MDQLECPMLAVKGWNVTLSHFFRELGNQWMIPPELSAVSMMHELPSCVGISVTYIIQEIDFYRVGKFLYYCDILQ